MKEKEQEFSMQTISLNIKGEIVRYILIFRKNESRPHIFSDFFIDNINGMGLLNKSYNTRKNFYAEYIIKFLNYIFIESGRKIIDIEMLTISLVEEFLNKYSKRDMIGDIKHEWRSAETLKKTNRALKIFVYWLCTKKVDNKMIFKMKYISEQDFKFENQEKLYNKYMKKRNIKDIFNYETSKNLTKRDKVTTARKYTIRKLLELSEIYDPMLTFGIVLGAFAGLRVGEIVQVNIGILKGFESNNKGCFMDLRKGNILRDDIRVTGDIKSKKKQIVYEGFSEIIKEYYRRHLDYLRYKGLSNKYGAIFINNRGNAMLDKNYIRRFSKLVNIYKLNVIKEAMNGDEDAKLEKEMLHFGAITPHSLRHFYSQWLEELEDGDIFSIRLYRRDSSVESQETYTKGFVTERMKNLQEKIIEDIYSYGDREK